MSIRTLLPVVLLFGLGSTAVAGTKTKDAAPLKVGAAITEKKAVSLEKLASDPKAYVGKTVRIEGTVNKVCQGMGCWVEVGAGKSVSFLAKSLDESVLLPKDCVGRKIVVQGVVTEMPAKGAEAHHHAEGEAVDHECPQPTFLLATQGVELLKAAKH